MAFKKIQSLDADQCITIGGYNKKLKKENPTSVEGYYLGRRTVAPTGKYGDSTLHFFQTSKGNVGVWGKTDLDKKLGAAPVGTMSRVTYKGTKPTKNGDMHTYLVEVDDENTIEVSALEAPTITDSSDDEGYSDDESEDEETEDYSAQEDVEVEESRPVISQANADRKAKVEAMLKKTKKVV